MKSRKVCIKTKLTTASLSLEGQVTKHSTVTLNSLLIMNIILYFRQLWEEKSMLCHQPANHWQVGLHRVLSRNAARLVVAMVTLQVINSLLSF